MNKPKVFRVVNNDTGEIIPNNDIIFSYITGELVPNTWSEKKCNLRLDEWTGTCNNSGVKIFENDIVRYTPKKETKWRQTISEFENLTFRVTWHAYKGFYLECIEKKFELPIGLPYFRSWNDVEVISIFKEENISNRNT